MATTWGTIADEIQALVQDSVFSDTGSMYSYLLIWGNRIQRNMHKEINFRHKLKYSAGTISFTGSSPVSMPSDFFKVSDRFIKVRQNASPDEIIELRGLDKLLDLDPGQNDTTSNAYPDAVAIESNKMYSTPLFTGTVDVEGYYTIPTNMTGDSDNPDFPDEDDAVEALIAGVSRRCFAHLKDPDMANYYTQEYGRLLEMLRIHNNKSDSNFITKPRQY
jgi:hypothetical protein